jgi:hypothetical protein
MSSARSTCSPVRVGAGFPAGGRPGGGRPTPAPVGCGTCSPRGRDFVAGPSRSRPAWPMRTVPGGSRRWFSATVYRANSAALRRIRTWCPTSRPIAASVAGSTEHHSGCASTSGCPTVVRTETGSTDIAIFLFPRWVGGQQGPLCQDHLRQLPQQLFPLEGVIGDPGVCVNRGAARSGRRAGRAAVAVGSAG